MQQLDKTNFNLKAMAVDLGHFVALEVGLSSAQSWHRPDLHPRVWFEQDGVVVRDVTPDLDPFVLDYMVKNYLTEEPMNQALRVSEDPLAAAEQTAIWEKLILSQRVSIVALQKGTPGADLEKVSEDCPPKIIGANLLFVTSKSDHELPDFRKVLKSEKVITCLHTFFETSSLVDVYERYAADHYLDGAGMSVASEWRGKGIGKMLLEARLNLCRSLDIPLTKTVFTSVQSQKVALKSGFELLGELVYSDLTDAEGQPRFPKMHPDQKRIQMMALKIT
ncbi:uncharacterized protein LOC132204407 [Neocloeon triangulifer]|uniref:uncharacterized protein LOC132204407 n=1 Tax=Neocloeon triangulifer TaxID=2078957 RepID=UPI00286F493D|nr:uncharacterized protein LOC132204407 [Neocloeon triangulifer]